MTDGNLARANIVLCHISGYVVAIELFFITIMVLFRRNIILILGETHDNVIFNSFQANLVLLLFEGICEGIGPSVVKMATRHVTRIGRRPFCMWVGNQQTFVGSSVGGPKELQPTGEKKGRTLKKSLERREEGQGNRSDTR
jgi:hypothetical protein